MKHLKFSMFYLICFCVCMAPVVIFIYMYSPGMFVAFLIGIPGGVATFFVVEYLKRNDRISNWINGDRYERDPTSTRDTTKA